MPPIKSAFKAVDFGRDAGAKPVVERLATKGELEVETDEDGLDRRVGIEDVVGSGET